MLFSCSKVYLYSSPYPEGGEEKGGMISSKKLCEFFSFEAPASQTPALRTALAKTILF